MLKLFKIVKVLSCALFIIIIIIICVH